MEFNGGWYWVGLPLQLYQTRIKAIRQGVKVDHVKVGSQQRARAALTWGTVMGVDRRAKEWGIGVSVGQVGLPFAAEGLRDVCG